MSEQDNRSLMSIIEWDGYKIQVTVCWQIS